MQRTILVNNWMRFLPVALVAGGAGIILVGLAADFLSLGGPEGVGPRQAALALSGLAVLLAGAALAAPAGRRHIGEWLLVGAAVIGVAFAADLLVINGLPEFLAKHAVLAATAFSVVLVTQAAPAMSMERQTWQAWLGRISLDKVSIGKFMSIVAQLGLLVLLVGQLRLENQAFYHNVMLLTFYGFLIHYFLPARYRLPFFLFLSLAAIAGILGFLNGAWLVGIGLALVGICHLPISYKVRVVMLLVAGAALAALQVGRVLPSGLAVIWPVLGSMFMFRLIIYMYDLRHGKAAPTPTSTLSYFFLLPNVVFPFFPVVDYSTFRRTYYDKEQYEIYQKGIQWMFRGVVQLIVYRYVNYYLVISPGDVTNTAELIRYLIANFALYVRISGQFHLIIGILHLFGFNLPETHHLYFLATSFTDLWRRINIYWKDFMMKVFYYPAFFRLRKWGPTASLVLATLFVFVMTWFLHAYQWFWLRGSFLLTAPDILFWFLLAMVVLVATLREARRGRKRTLQQPSVSFRNVAGQALRAAGVFSIMIVLWALWSSESVLDWLSLLAVVELSLADAATLLLAFLAIAVVLGTAIWVTGRAEKAEGVGTTQAGFFKAAAATGGAILLLFFVSSPAVYGQVGGRTGELIGDLSTNRLSAQEAALLQQGYYEDLIGVDRFNSQLWDIYSKRPSDWPTITETEAARHTNDNLIVEMVPSISIDFHGARLSTNQWGMRDQDYALTPPDGTYRIALTGPSFVMGFGVADDEVFEWILEERLNREDAGGEYARYEILNFAVPGYSAIQNLMVMEQKGFSFQPDALFFIAHQREEEAVVLYLADRLAAGAELPYPELVELARQAGFEDGMTKNEAVRLLRPVESEILALTYRRIAEESRSKGIVPVWIFMPTLEYPLQEEKVVHLRNIALEAGLVVLDLSPAYEGQNPESLVIAYWDKHPNALGHRLIADQLYQELLTNESMIPLGLSAPMGEE